MKITKKLQLSILLLFLTLGYVFGQKTKYPQIRSYVSSSITSNEKNYEYILYRIRGEEIHLDSKGFIKGRSKTFNVADSLISPMAAVSRIKEIPKQHSGSKSKLINKKYYGGNNPVPRLDIFKSDTLKLSYWVEIYHEKVEKK